MPKDVCSASTALTNVVRFPHHKSFAAIQPHCTSRHEPLPLSHGAANSLSPVRTETYKRPVIPTERR